MFGKICKRPINNFKIVLECFRIFFRFVWGLFSKKQKHFLFNVATKIGIMACLPKKTFIKILAKPTRPYLIDPMPN
jgi:hypothetical protein